MSENDRLIEEFQNALIQGILKLWYPLVVDKEYGGYYTNVLVIGHYCQIKKKMIVSQSRHIWTLSKVTEYFHGDNDYRLMARHGFLF